MITSTEKQKIEETEVQRIRRNKREILDSVYVTYLSVKLVPLHKLIIQFVFSILLTLLYTTPMLVELLNLKNVNNPSLSLKLLIPSLYTVPQIVLFCFLFKKNLLMFFRKFNVKQIKLSVWAGIYSLGIAMGINGLLEYGFSYTAADHTNTVSFVPSDSFILIIQLLGEEILFFSTFFFILKLFTYAKKPQYGITICVSSLLSCALFGLAHLFTYDFRIIQCLFIIGFPCFIKILLLFKTRNLWCTYSAHLVHDLLAVLIVAYGTLVNQQ
ncbi:type II CAAX prenyl endopeptidase Rce1 family protein [Priestia megaterium]|uniref:CPBP family glutamic-type intramembrane protease n=1 Tax=Priestia megaterium TaxID=1404 RepID=UPI0023DA2BA3|nr:CPBP family glutamic-type intramembrane protease [Priestia megaterium]MDF2052614.1 hypothetical protein [Priestia megaterium]MDF2058736.1 hypothetical protein [Priestia megaterium]